MGLTGWMVSAEEKTPEYEIKFCQSLFTEATEFSLVSLSFA